MELIVCHDKNTNPTERHKDDIADETGRRSLTESAALSSLGRIVHNTSTTKQQNITMKAHTTNTHNK